MEFNNKLFTMERALFGSYGVSIADCAFESGESAVKECTNVAAVRTDFRWKYPLWYCRGVKVEESKLSEGARAGVWYTENASFTDTPVLAPKCFRRCKGLTLENVDIPNAAETLWNCEDVRLKNVNVKGDYFAMNCKRTEVDTLDLDGNYVFDGAEDLTIRNSKLITKDAFWNSKNVTVYDSYIKGEYLAWNSQNVTLIRCTIESLQGLCYIENLKLVDCKLINTSLAFEKSSVDAVFDEADSVFDPKCGVIKANKIGNLVLSGKNETKIVCDNIYKITNEPDWSEIL